MKDLTTNEQLIKDNLFLASKILNKEAGFIPNWKKLGLKNQKEGIKHIIEFVRKEHKHIADRAYGEMKLMDGNENVLLDLKGSKIKRKKEFIQSL